MTLARRLNPLAPGLTARSVLEKFAAVQMIDVPPRRPRVAGSLIATTHLFSKPEIADCAPDDRFRALVAARPGREQAQAMASQLMFQQTGFARLPRSSGTGAQEPDFEGFVRDADIAKRIRVIVTFGKAARRRAIRGKWARMAGNDGRTRVRVPDHCRPPGAPSGRTDGTPLLIEMLKAQTAGLQAHIESLKTRIAGTDSRDAECLAELARERELAHKAISAFTALAERLDALAAGRARPWWRRLVG